MTDAELRHRMKVEIAEAERRRRFWAEQAKEKQNSEGGERARHIADAYASAVARLVEAQQDLHLSGALNPSPIQS